MTMINMWSAFVILFIVSCVALLYCNNSIQHSRVLSCRAGFNNDYSKCNKCQAKHLILVKVWDASFLGMTRLRE